MALATIEDAASLTAAFGGAEGVFVLVRQTLIRSRDFPRRERLVQRCALRAGNGASGASGLSFLHRSTGQVSQGLLTQHTIIEQALSDLPVPITFLRPAWFMENCRWDVGFGA